MNIHDTMMEGNMNNVTPVEQTTIRNLVINMNASIVELENLTDVILGKMLDPRVEGGQACVDSSPQTLKSALAAQQGMLHGLIAKLRAVAVEVGE